MTYEPTPIEINQTILEITPGDIKINLIQGKDHIVELKLKNLTSRQVAFKVKTTAPDKYQVRPIQATIAGGETSTCMIVLKAMSPLPDPTDSKNLKHKFLIQSVYHDEETEIGAFWKLVESVKVVDGKPTYHDQRIVCTLIVPTEATALTASSPTIVPTAVTPVATSSSNAILSKCQQDLADKKKEFDGLMDFTLKQNNQIKTLTMQLQQKTDESEQLKRSVSQLEKNTATAASVNTTTPANVNQTAPISSGIPQWAVLAAFAAGLVICRLVLCPGCEAIIP
jgi:hypothetical protein